MPNQQVEKNHKWLALFSLIGPLSLIFIDQTALPIALPTLQREFELNFSQLQWVINAYLLPLATFILASGSMGDLFGHRRIFLPWIDHLYFSLFRLQPKVDF
jgi:MFS family permease